MKTAMRWNPRSGHTGRSNRLGIAMAAALAVALPVQAALNLADAPLQLTPSIEPNIVFILDDSGSMSFEIMPDNFSFWGVTGALNDPSAWGGWVQTPGLISEACSATSCDWHRASTGYVLFTFPWVTNVYGTTGNYPRWYTNVATVQGLNLADATWPAYAALTRSPQVNTVFYNPSITYTPWSDANGEPMADAPPNCAPHNPMTPALGCRNLTANIVTRERWANCAANSFATNQCARTFDQRTFWPATYFWHTGGDVWSPGNYQRTFIRDTTPTYTGHGRANRSECVNGSCTYQQEIQNFANWYSYYRSRILAARAGIGKAFAQQPESIRVGFAAINQAEGPVDGNPTTRTIIRGVRSFFGADRADFFQRLYTHAIPAAGTPLRQALMDTGDYYSRTDASGPWGNQPGTADNTPQLACRQSYAILMTDGYWNGPGPGVGNVDGTGGPLITGPGGQSYQYAPSDPYRDANFNTLADVAMAYWKQDLRLDLPNQVPTSPGNPAFWQHMVTFGVGLGVEGTIDPDDAWTAVANGTPIAWPAPLSADAAKLDDLLHAGINGRGGYFTASDPDTFAEQLSDTLNAIVAGAKGSSSAVAANASRIGADTLIYQALFNPDDWSGELLAIELQANGSPATYHKWDAAEKIPTPAQRKIFTTHADSHSGVPFQWADLAATQQAALNRNASGTVDGLGQARLGWLRGETVDEQRNGGVLRDRSSPLGDIVNSETAFVGQQNFGNASLPGLEGSRYTAFRSSTAYKTRENMLYVGANDGMLHGFSAVSGVERFAYVPKAVFADLSQLTAPTYSHRYYVDGSPRVLDAYIDPAYSGAKSWHTVLLGSTGAGARSVFALDVTDPVGFGANDVLWELSDADLPELGYTLGQPTIARVKAGDRWVALVPNGYNSASHTARLFVIDLASGQLLKELDTGVGSAAQPNGLHAVLPVDVDGDRITDLAYAGDLYGNLWKFDLRATTAAGWKIAENGGLGAAPLFTATDAFGVPQPIAVRPTVGAHPLGGVMVYFGTGKFFEAGDETVPVNPQLQSFYGIWDKGLAVGARQDYLQEQNILWQGVANFTQQDGSVAQHALRLPSDTPVDYATKLGWFMDLRNPNRAYGEGERVISRALVRDDRLIFSTTIPSDDPCEGGLQGWVMELDAVNGSSLAYPVFDLTGDNEFNLDDTLPGVYPGLSIPGGRQMGTGQSSPLVLEPSCPGPDCEEDGVERKYLTGAGGAVESIGEKPGAVAGRKGWWQLR